MILYHGTNIDFQIIEIEKSNPYKDFGRGFYLTDIFSQAENMANKKARILGGFLLYKNITLRKVLYQTIISEY